MPPAYASAIRRTIVELDGRLGLAPYLPFDRTALEAHGQRLLSSAGRDVEEGFLYATRAILGAYPIGHLVFYPGADSACGTAAIPQPASSLLGACTQPFGDHAVVTAAMTGNPLGLAAGDEIVAVDGRQGQAMMNAAFDHPMCGVSGSASPSHRRAVAATTLLATVPVGSSITIKRVSGAIETKLVTALAGPMTCSDPFGRAGGYAARAVLRPDGVGVVHVPSFYPAAHDEADPMGSVTRFEDAIVQELAKVRNAAYVVIDVRGNTGGFPYVALQLAGGFPGAVQRLISRCDERVANTSQYQSASDLEITPSPKFALSGRVAVLSDGLSFSATDYFLRAARLSTNALVVGRPSAGAYGSSGSDVRIDGGPAFRFYVDPWRCFDDAGKLLEGQSVAPHIEQDLVPAKLAQGIDSDLETAVSRLRGL